MNSPLTILCIASYYKGIDFLKQCKREGCRVLLLTSKSLESKEWPRESIDEIFYIPDKNNEWNMKDVIYGVSYLARKEKIDRIVALDDFDVEKAATLREHLRIGGMGDTTARYFRDKLAMRKKALDDGINVPPFVHLLNYDDIKRFISKVKFPYIIKPRMKAGAIGLIKVNSEKEVWQALETLGDEQSFYLMEKFVKGDVYHSDTIIQNKKIIFVSVSKYGLPPMEVAHLGRVFTSKTVSPESDEAKEVAEFNQKIIESLGLVYGVSHTEFIRSEEDGKLYFLETSARVGGANLSELVKAATGINLWEEWAKIEKTKGEGYKLPEIKSKYAAIITSLAKQEWPDLSGYDAPEVVWKLKKKYHAGLIIASEKEERINELLEEYINRFYDDFFTTQPMTDLPSD